MTVGTYECKHDAEWLLDAIETDSEAIVRLLQACGSSSELGPEQQRQFGKLLRHRRQLITRLEYLRIRNRSNSSQERTSSPSSILSA
jgi:hypothetical protein